MNVKGFFQSVRNEQYEIELLLSRRNDIISIPGLRYDRESVQTYANSDLSKTALKLLEFDKELQNRINILIDKKQQAMRYINTLQDSLQRSIMTIYYLDRKKIPGISATRPYTFFEIANMLNVSPDYVRHLHGYALQNIAKNLINSEAETTIA